MRRLIVFGETQSEVETLWLRFLFASLHERFHFGECQISGEEYDTDDVNIDGTIDLFTLGTAHDQDVSINSSDILTYDDPIHIVRVYINRVHMQETEGRNKQTYRQKQTPNKPSCDQFSGI